MLRLLWGSLAASLLLGCCRIAVAQGLTAEEAVARMTVPSGFEVSLVAAEPVVRQPVTMEFDDRGRLWVIQYLQYPNPEGLRRVSVDRYSRTQYDRVPEPPPRGPRGADRISVLEDSDGDGRMDRATDFVDGLNLATGLAFGHGGVFVLNVPWLLFYPDRDRNDVPDADPEVLLTGFGMEDAHSVANSLTWGPDGWLYGCQGSTVTARIRGIEFQQGVWRYHPVTRQFELFCEGGGNSWGLDFDRTGRLFYSTNYGGYTLLHGVQGGYYVKSFGKHGALHNPHAYGYFEHAPHRNFQGGHVTVGGIVYQGDSFPAAFRDTYIAGDLLGHGVNWHAIQPRGSTVQTAHGGELLQAHDTWFAPTDLTLGPDGAVYVADWHDARMAHPDPDAEWDRSNGRIFRIAARGTPHVRPPDLATRNIQELVRLLQHRSQWYVRRARQELVRRLNAAAADEAERNEILQLRTLFLQGALQSTAEVAAAEQLWSLQAVNGLDEQAARQLLDSPHPAVRAWTVRLLGDRGQVSDEMAHRLDEFAEQEPDVGVRQQLACTARRLPAHQALPVINANINRDLDHDDPFLPLLWWWAVEQHSVAGREEVLRRFVRPTLWKSRLGRDVLLTRLIRRYAAEQSSAGLDAVLRLLQAAPDAAAQQQLWPNVLLGWQEQPEPEDPAAWHSLVLEHPLSARLLEAWQAAPPQSALRDTLQELGIRLHLPEPRAATVQAAFSAQTETAQRIAALHMLRGSVDAVLLEPALPLLDIEQPPALRSAALQLLAEFSDERVTRQLIAVHRAAPDNPLNGQIRDVLLTRPESARAWLMLVENGELPAAVTSLEQIRRVALLNDPELDALVVRHWGRLEGTTREEKLAEVRRLNNDLRAGSGDAAAGQLLFRKHCAACHRLFGEGTQIGPDLTTANRQDRDFLLISLVDPHSVIRREFVSVIIETRSGRVLTGMPLERTDATLTLADAQGNRQSVAVSDIDDMQDSPLSLMPDNLYRQLRPQELRDLFAYLQSRR